METVQLKYMTGEVDFGRESATIDNITLYKENEETAHITAYVTHSHQNPTNLHLNTNYGLNSDGTVKDDDQSRAWQEVIQKKRFRQAVMHSIDAEEMIDSVYNSFVSVNPYYACDHDVELSKSLLDEMGVVDIDGYRESPSGLPLQWLLWNSQDANDFIPVCELMVEFFAEVGLKIEVYTTEPSLLSASLEANEILMRLSRSHTTQLWHYLDWGLISQTLWHH